MLLLTVLAFTAVSLGAFLFLRGKKEWQGQPPAPPSPVSLSGVLETPAPSSVFLPVPSTSNDSLLPRQGVKIFSAQAVSGVSPVYDFSMYVPASWSAESLRSLESINLYEASGVNKIAIENSRMLIRYFRANSFLTLSSVKIISRKEIVVSGRPAVDYVIEKKPGYPNFPKQPLWRNAQHRVVDVRVSDTNPSIFYVFSKSPELSDEVFDAMLDTLVLSPQDLLFYPVDSLTWLAPTPMSIGVSSQSERGLAGGDFSSAISKKPFGIFITPANSPVTLEKFTGYHTGVDLEIPETVSTTALIPVVAIADGVVERSGKAEGYGGVVAIRHQIGDDSYLAIYGYLNPKPPIKVGARVKAGQVIGVLGKAFSSQTSGERRHLHFGLYRGEDINIAGYVQQESDLQNWLDPLKFFAERMP